MPASRTSDPKARTKAPKTDSSAAPTSSSSTRSKRVRVVEPEDAPEDAAPEKVEVPKSKGKKGKGDESSGRKDLRDKSLDEIVPVVSAEARAPAKGALKKSPKKVAPAPVEVEEPVEDEAEEEIDFLAGFESAGGEDSSDEEDGEEGATFKLDELPKVSEEEAGVQKKLQAKAERKKNVCSFLAA